MSKHPIFSSMSEDEINKYIVKFINNSIKNGAMSQTLHPEYKQDFAQDVFIAIKSRIHRYDPKKSQFKTWAFNWARHCLTKLHKKTIKRGAIKDISKLNNLLEQKNKDFAAIEEEVGPILNDLEKEDEVVQKIIKLHFYERYNYERIGTELQMKPKKVQRKIIKFTERMKYKYEKC